MERFNRSLKEMLSKLVNSRRNDWDTILPYVMAAYRATPHTSTGLTPNRIMLGREVMLPVDLVYGYKLPDVPPCPLEYVEWIRGAMNEGFQTCRQQLHKAAELQAHYYNRLSSEPGYTEGQWVLLFYPPLAAAKLALRFIGPFKVVRKASEVTYEIEAPLTKKRKIVHVNHMKPYLYEVTHEDMPLLPDLPQNNDLEDLIQSLQEDGGTQGMDRSMEEAEEEVIAIPDFIKSPLKRTRRPPERLGHNVGYQ